jgi:hypothetical protein
MRKHGEISRQPRGACRAAARPPRLERRLVRAHGHEAVGTLRAMLEAIAGAEQSVDPRMRAFYL